MSTVQRLLDEREITRGLAGVARILDGKQWTALDEIFAEDLEFNYGWGGEQRGIEALRALLRRFLDVCGSTQHLIGSITVDIEGDQAVSRAYVQARHQRRDDPTGPVFDSNGEYIDRWERRVQGWRIVRRDAKWLTHFGDPAILAISNKELG
jgi:3-phenylpropionate/cinnamic acid dioxygenase small subunit